MENGLISAADAKTYDKMVQDIQSYGEEIERLEQLQSMEDTLRRPTAAPLTARPGSKAGRASDEYKNALLTALRTNFKDVDSILREGQDESGGYLVPDEYDHRLVEALEQENIFRKLATTINTTGLHKINVAAVKPAAAWVHQGCRGASHHRPGAGGGGKAHLSGVSGRCQHGHDLSWTGSGWNPDRGREQEVVHQHR